MGEENTNTEPAKDITSLKARLDMLNSEKEKWFAKKEELKQKIADLIKEVREVKAKNDSLSSAIKDLKEKRDLQNADVRTLIENIKEVNVKRENKFPLEKKDPEALKKRIAHLTMRIETAAVSFDDEKKCMKEIKQLKKELELANVSVNAAKQAGEISKNIDSSKRKAEDFHAQMSNLAKENKEAYKEFTRLSKEINRVKKEQEDAFENFIKFKQEFSAANKGFKDEVKKVNVERRDKKHVERKRKERVVSERKEIEHKKIEEKKERVEEKIKGKGKKILTTEDLIAFQGNEEEEK